MVPLSKSGVAQVTAGSNPALSASFYEQKRRFRRLRSPTENHPTGRFVAHLSPKSETGLLAPSLGDRRPLPEPLLSVLTIIESGAILE